MIKIVQALNNCKPVGDPETETKIPSILVK